LRSDRARLRDILERCEYLREYVASNLDQLPENIVLASAVQTWLQVIGEAAANVSQELQEAHPEVTWRGAIGLRNMIVHGYGALDMQVLRGVITNDVPVMEAQIRAILAELD
jgi:uncharacterized protein with HEPN domain